MGTTLQHGIFLPAEGERNCYAGLAANWTALDGMIGGYSSHAANLTIHVTAADKAAWNGKADASALTAHTGDTTIHVTAEDKEAWNGKADTTALTAHTGDTTIHVTAEDKQAWNGKADASALTAHTGDTTIHVTAEDKQAWNGKADASALAAHTGNTTIHVTAEDKSKWDAVTSKANDSDVVHKSGNETVGGEKTFTSSIKGYNSDSTQSTVSIDLRTSKVSRGNTSDGVDTFGFGFRDKNNSALVSISCVKRSTGESSEYHTVNTTDSSNNVLSESYSFNLSKDGTATFRPETNDKTLLGTSTKRWKDCQTYLINGLTPSSLSMPATTGTIDISSYVTDLTGVNINNYIPPANGYIVITCNSTDVDYIKVSNNLNFVSVIDNTNNQFTSGILGVWQPCVAGIGIQIRIKASVLNSAKFIPCQGNV